jgi:LysM repeat protein
MRWQGVALISTGVNVILAVVLLLSFGSRSRAPGTSGTNIIGVVTGAGRTNTIVQRQLFTWHDIESPNYAVYVANLRDIGCPEQTIRDIIIADVNALFSRRRATELVTPDQQWWRSEPDSNVVAVAAMKAQALESERATLLTELLGPNWESGDLASIPRPTRSGVTLDGPVLGTLPLETKQALQNISARSEDRVLAYLEQMKEEGKAPDPAELARIRQDTRRELAGVLSPLQLEEFLLRYSENANALRTNFGELKYFNATPDEFRTVFRAVDTIDQQIAAITGTDANSVQGRRALEAQRENAIKLALGQRRYEEYRMLQDPLYRQAMATAIAAGTPEEARTLYLVNVAAAEQQASITNNPALTAAQREIELKQLEADQLRANAVATGQELPPEPASTPQAPPPRTYTIRRGDSLAVVALIYGVPPSALREANPGVNWTRLQVGQSLNIPRNALVPPPGPP